MNASLLAEERGSREQKRSASRLDAVYCVPRVMFSRARDDSMGER